MQGGYFSTEKPSLAQTQAGRAFIHPLPLTPLYFLFIPVFALEHLSPYNDFPLRIFSLTCSFSLSTFCHSIYPMWFAYNPGQKCHESIDTA